MIPTPGFVTPLQPDASMIDIIHRANDGYVCFATKDADGNLHQIASLPARAMPGLFDQMVEDLDTNSFFTLNAFFRPGWGESKYTDEFGNPLKRGHRKSKDVRWLTAVWVDLDCYRLKMEPGEVIGKLIQLQDADEMPPASLFTRSGSGVWVLWLLAEHGTNGPVKAWQEKIAAWHRVQRVFTQRFAKFGADPNSIDAARVTRIPGSINPKRNFARVGYWVQLDTNGKPFTYTLDTLAEWAGVQVKVRQHRPKPLAVGGKKTIYQERASKGQAGRWNKAVENFEKLWDLRGTWRPGTRNAAALAWATILFSMPKSVRWPDQRFREELDDLFADMEQPAGERYERQEFDATVQSAKGDASRRKAFRLAGATNQTFANWLDITPDEAAELPSWPCAAKYKVGDEPPPRLSRGEAQERRREWLRQNLAAWKANRDPMPTLKDLADRIELAGLPKPSQATVQNDLDALGVENPRKRRQRTRPRTRTLFD